MLLATIESLSSDFEVKSFKCYDGNWIMMMSCWVIEIKYLSSVYPCLTG